MGSARTTNDRVIAVITDNAASLLRIAQAHSLCADDAQDAYQRALEIYLERLDEVRDATAGEWLRTVCKHEAIRIRAQRQRVLPAQEVLWDAHESPDVWEADDRAASLERVARAAEALRGCKPDEATALLLKADGSTYAEIGELTGWTRTKVNRCLVEGRERFMRRFSAIDAGVACGEHAGALGALVDGEATAEDLGRLRPHLRHCASCRAALRDLYDSEPALGALVPAGAVVAAAPGEVGGALARVYEALAAGLAEKVTRAHAMVEALTSTKAAAVVASTAAVAAGGAAAADRAVDRPQAPRQARVQQVPEPRERLPRRPGRTVGVAPVVAAVKSGPRAHPPVSRVRTAPVATPEAGPTPEFAIEAVAAAPPEQERPRARPVAEEGFSFE